MAEDDEIRALCYAAHADPDVPGVAWEHLRIAYRHLDDGALYIQDWRNIFDVYVPVWNPRTDCIRLEDDPPFRENPGIRLPPGIKRSQRGGPLEYPWAIVAKRCGCQPLDDGRVATLSSHEARFIRDSPHLVSANGGDTSASFNWILMLVVLGVVLTLGLLSSVLLP